MIATSSTLRKSMVTYEEVKDALQWDFQLAQHTSRTAFQLHLQQRLSTPRGFLFLTLLTLIFLVILLPYSLILLLGDATATAVGLGTSLCCLLAALTGCLACLALHVRTFPEHWCWLHVLRRNSYRSQTSSISSVSFPSDETVAAVCTALIAAAIHLLVMMVFVRRSLQVDCDHVACYSQESLDLFSLYLFVIPVLVFVHLPAICISFVFCQLLSSCVLYVCIYLVYFHVDVWTTLSFLLFWLFVSGLTVTELQMQRVLSFLNVTKLQQGVDDKEQTVQSLELKIHEVRSLLGNVAHDLKTPLASFSNGIELIQQSVDSFQHNVTSTHSFLSQVQVCLSDISNTNSFMLMSINRCIDFTKASKDLKLVPRNETMTLLETIALPMSCMKNIQQRIAIVLKDVSADICSHIITDKQWLQENMLCLLSNAVKYSNDGVVEIDIRLVQHDRPHFRIERDHTYEDSVSSELSSRSNSRSNSICQHHNHIPSMIATSPSRSIDVEAGVISRVPSDDGSVAKERCHNNLHKQRHHHQQQQAYLRVEIQDSGIGISEEAAKLLFNPFNQTQRLAGGTGLGLYSLAKRIEALGGFYGVHSRPDQLKGSVFWFEIPYKADEVAASFHKLSNFQQLVADISVESTTNISNNNNVLSEGSSKHLSLHHPVCVPTSPISFQQAMHKLHILIAEDSPTISKMTSMLLRRAGHEVCIAENGAVAIQMVQQKYEQSQIMFDMILMDLQMPIIDGLEAMKRIRSWEKGTLQRNSIVAVSANSDEDTTEVAYQAGADGFLPKPFTMESFNRVYTKLTETQ